MSHSSITSINLKSFEISDFEGYHETDRLTVEDHDAPLLLFEPAHGLLGLPGPLLLMGDHVEGGDEDGAAHGLVLGVRRKAANHRVVGRRPHLELMLPLLHRHARVAQHQRPFAYRAARRNAHQTFSSTCRAKQPTFMTILWIIFVNCFVVFLC